ncbi:VirB4-like conjugal transfer ATPase, CD1110 family [Slackia isoflavoniconvertens]|uniref:VirB4-like conjugal transfer ATPase, CD1110 family n=1 Tax=Slackia isoflavoniconvertens TaxID=572010 RepID=UPI003F983440
MSLLSKREKAAGAKADKKAGKKQRRPKGTIELCGYELMLENGVAQVAPGVFSQMIEFGDITYQCARKDTRESIYSTMSSMYNYFNPDTSVQVTITNEPVPAEEIGNRAFFPKSDPVLDEYVDEYNRILNDKMREGVSNLKRHRYLTFTTKADDIDSAIPKLARMRNDCIQALGRIKSKCEQVKGEERLRITHSMLSPLSPFDFNWDNLSQCPTARSVDFVAPMAVDFKPNGRHDAFRSDDAWCCVMAIRSFGSIIMDDCLANVVDLPMPLSVSLHLKPIPQDKAIDMVQGKIDWMDMEERGQKSRAANKGIILTQTSTALRYSRADAEELLDFLRNKNERLFEYAGYVFTYAASEAELNEQVDRIISKARESALTIEKLAYRQQEGWLSALPFATNKCDVTRLLTSGQIAMQMPFASLEINQPGGIYLGQSKITNTLAILDRLSLPSPMGFDFGTPGTGKSNAQKSVWLQVRMLYGDKAQGIWIDPTGEGRPVAEAGGGVSIKLSADSGQYMNPFDKNDVSDLDWQLQNAFKVDAFLALSASLMAEGNQGLTQAERSIIARCVEEAYRQAGHDEVPILEDFYNLLLQQPESVAKDIALRYERHVKGSFSFFNHRSNVAIEAPMVNIDLHDLNSDMRVFGMLTALEQVRNRMYRNFANGKATWLFIDEVQSLFKHPAVIAYFESFWAEGRKFGLVATGLSQNASFMLGSEIGATMILNSDYLMLHKQSSIDRDLWAETLNLSEEEISFIDDGIKPGDGLLVAGGARMPITNELPKGKIYDLLTTRPSEVSALGGGGRSAR